MKRFLAAALTFIATQASAATATVDYSDLWYNPSESGWGFNMAHQSDTIFLTLFVYGADRSPTWYVASGMTYQPLGGADSFSGQLFATTGTPFNVNPFVSSSVTAVSVGTVTFTATSATSGTLNYTVNGQNVVKSVVRQNFRNEILSGQFLGGTSGTISGCSQGNGFSETPASYTLSTTGNQVRIDEFITAAPTYAAYVCTYTGTYTQAGRLGAVSGSGTCSNSTVGQTIDISELEIGSNYFAGRTVIGLTPSCRFTGRIGGVRKTS